MYTYKGKVTRVIDGDTIEVLTDLGFHIFHTIRVRLYQVDAPELFTGSERDKGAKAKEHLVSLVDGKEVLIYTFKDKMSFNRYVANVEVIGEETKPNINELMEEFCKGL